MEHWVVIASVVLSAGMSLADGPRLSVSARGGVFAEEQVPVVALEGASGDVGWTLLDWRRLVVRTGAFPADGRQSFPDLPRGYYFVQAAGAVTNVREATFCLVADPATRKFPRDSFYGVDAALSWVCSPEHYAEKWYGEDSYAACLDLIRLAGLVHVRERLSWREVSKTPGTYNWGRYLKNAKLAHDRGLVVSGMFHDAAPYADVLRKGPRDLAAVYRFSRDAARAFGEAMGDWEFWNEPDIGFYPEPVWDYMSAQKAAYLGFKAANRERPVLNGAVCTGSYAAYEDALFANDLAKYSDVFNFHTYHDIAAYPALLGRLHACLNRSGVADRAAWLTEYGTNLEGHSAGNGLMKGAKAHSYEQELVLAEVYAKSTTLMQMKGVSRGYWFVFGAYNERNGAKDWGVQRRDGSVKPIYLAMATTTECLSDAKIEGELKVAEGVRAFLFRHKDGRQCLVSWSETPCDTVQGQSEAPLKSVGKSFDRPFSLSVKDGVYTVADWCGVKSSVRAHGGRLVLSASRYASFLDGISGLKPDVPATAAGRVAAAATAADEDLSVVLRAEFATNDFQVVQGKTAVETTGDRGRVKLVLWNLSDEPKSGTVEADGVALEGMPSEIRLPPMGSATVDVTLVYTNAAAPAVQAVFTGTFNGRRTSRLVVRVRSEKRFYDLCTVTALGKEGVPYWTRNDSASRTKITWDEKEGAVRFDCEWDDPQVDRWFYPLHMFKSRDESFDGAVELEFDVRMESNKMENDVSCSLVMFIGGKDKGGSASYLPPNGNWEKRKVALSDSWGRPRYEGLSGFRVGCNPKGTRMTYWIRNLRLFRMKTK